MPPSASLRHPLLRGLTRPAILAAAVLAVASVAALSGPADRVNTGARAAAAASRASAATDATYYGRQVSVDGENWSGVLIPDGSFSSVTANWTEPKVSCTHTNDLMAPWVGIDGQNNNTVEQTGIETSCRSGHPRYLGWYEMYPAPAVYYHDAVHSGDRISATVTRKGSVYTLKLTDHTQHWSHTTVRHRYTGHSSAEVVLESPNSAYPRYSRVNFSGTVVNGHTLTHYSLLRMNASSKHGTLNHTSVVTGGNFSVSYRHE